MQVNARRKIFVCIKICSLFNTRIKKKKKKEVSRKRAWKNIHFNFYHFSNDRTYIRMIYSSKWKVIIDSAKYCSPRNDLLIFSCENISRNFPNLPKRETLPNVFLTTPANTLLLRISGLARYGTGWAEMAASSWTPSPLSAARPASLWNINMTRNIISRDSRRHGNTKYYPAGPGDAPVAAYILLLAEAHGLHTPVHETLLW